MKASVSERYGPPEVLHFKEVEKPVTGDDGVLVKVHTASVNFNDSAFVTGKPLLSRLWIGLLKPKYKILGTDIAGQVEAVGNNVKQFRPGDEVFAEIGNYGYGAFAEYVSVPENALVLKPINMSYEEAAAVPQAAVTALQGLRDKGLIQAGQKVLIVGASGGNGTYAVQIAKHHLGAEVTGVCSTSKLEYVRSLGADKVIDYTQEDFTKNGEVYDVIFDTVGKTSVSRTHRSLKKDGWYLLATFSLPMVIQLMWLWKVRKQNIEMGTLSEENEEELTFFKELIEAGVIKPTIDKTYPLAEAAEAHRYVETGQKMGNVVITV